MNSKESSKTYYDSHTRPVQYKSGQYIYLKNRLRLRWALSPVRKGPYKIVRVNGNNSLTLLINRRHVTHHVDQIRYSPLPNHTVRNKKHKLACRIPCQARNQQDYYIQQIDSSPGLYFVYLGYLKINSGQLNAIMPFDLSHILVTAAVRNSYVTDLPHITSLEQRAVTCAPDGDETGLAQVEISCHNMISPLVARYSDIYKEFSSISYLLEKRSKRALIGGAGTIIKQIFGNLDETDGLRFNDAITYLHENQIKLASLMKNNVLLITSTISSYNDTVNKIRVNEINLNKAIDILSTNLANVTNATNQMLLHFNMYQILNNLETSIITLSFQLEDITNAVLFGNQNILQPSVSTPQLVDNH
ncbi:unnamed protein product [Leptidea sinapis]|uniref:Uncharacterized protein n=1 Tax=Leptidea sinapis TaxID=189913 RepID=A0A5E4PSB8_9NEOP|nr:unnamed protein product [Leptidea sinapis]